MEQYEPFFSTDEELVELGNYLIGSDEFYEEETEYNGNTYKIVKKEDSSKWWNHEKSKSLTISRGNKSLIITAREYTERKLDYSRSVYDYFGGYGPATMEVKRYSLSFDLKNSINSMSCFLEYHLGSFHDDFSLDNFQSRNEFDVGDKNYSVSIDKSLSIVRKYGEYTINDSCVDYKKTPVISIKYSLDGKKLLDIDSINLELPKEFILKRLSTFEDFNNFNPSEEAKLLFQVMKDSYPDYDQEDLMKSLIKYVERKKNSTRELFDRYMSEAQTVIALRNTFMDEVEKDENGRYLYFSKDELRYLIGYIGLKDNCIEQGNTKIKQVNGVKHP